MNLQAQITEEQKAAAIARTKKTIDELRYALLDVDRNGWTDPWEKKYPAHAKDKTGDPDGDGLDNWTEMLDGTDPSRANKKGEIYRSPEQIAKEAESAARSEVARQVKELALAPQLAAGALVAAGAVQLVTDAEHVEKLRQESPATLQPKADEERRLLLEAEQKATRDGYPRRTSDGRGKVSSIVRFEGERPVVISTFNANSGKSIGVNLLHQGVGTIPPLTGSGVNIAIWDGGRILDTHTEFALSPSGTRILAHGGENDLQPPATGVYAEHSTNVAGVIAARGNTATAKGMGILSSVQSRTFDANISELTAVLDTPGNTFRLSNHSYGQVAGWHYFVPHRWTVSGSPVNWEWLGDFNDVGDRNGNTIANEYADWQITQDYQFGLYSYESKEADRVCYFHPDHLPIWASGNENPWNSGAPGAINLGQGPSSGTRVIFYYGKGDSASAATLVLGANGPADGLSSGAETITAYSCSKNSLVIGSIDDLPSGWQNAAGVTLSAFSSRGPTDDQRIKPDLVANGAGMVTSSAASTTALTAGTAADTSGTSFAAPSVTGAAALLEQLYRDRVNPTRKLLASTLKALLIHTADEAGTIGPDYRFGWGVVDSDEAAQTLLNNALYPGYEPHAWEFTLYNGSTVEVPVVSQGGVPLKITIVWTDPAYQSTTIAPVNASDDDGNAATIAGLPAPAYDGNVTTLINDVDLRLVGPSNTLGPWQLTYNPANPTAPATAPGASTDDIRNNVEQIVLDSPGAGTAYTIRVSHKGSLRRAELVQPGETGYLDASNPRLRLVSGAQQRISIIVTGNIPDPLQRLRITSFAKTSTQHLVEWKSTKGLYYQLQESTDLVNWANVGGLIQAATGTSSYTVTSPPAGDRRFYRVVEQ